MAKLLQVNVGKNLNAPKKTNKYSRRNADIDAKDPKTLAINELNKYYEYMECEYLPKMKLLTVLGAIDKGGHPQETYYIGHKGHVALVKYVIDSRRSSQHCASQSGLLADPQRSKM
eukprot:6021946-Ditylum_brightwellii.AAC.1